MKNIRFFIIALAAAVGVSAVSLRSQDFGPEQKLIYAKRIIEQCYVDTVSNDTLVTEAIVAMLKTLDPHSVYSTPQETQELNQPLEGKFSGIGVQFSIVRDTVCVVQTTQGGPSEKVGIRPGDRIVYVNDTLFTKAKMSNMDVLKTLRGPKGSKVRLRIKRAGTPELIQFNLTRADIPIHSVDAAYMAAPEVGYVRISRFGQDTPQEVEDAIKKLKAKGMKHLIIDLEDNGGGYLGAAHSLASPFLKNGDMVVYTKGVQQPASYLRVEGGKPNGIDRVVVMVNQYSASASEILAGAIQDHDRGVIVGRRTFGKGLVQRPFPFPDGSMIRLTTAKYYTPSGRCIQKPYKRGHGEEYQLDMLNRMTAGELWSADSVHFDTTQVYRTLRNKRVVYGGGGIMPDAFVPVDTTHYSTYYRDLVAKGIVNSFVTDWLDSNRASVLAKYKTEDDFAANYSAAPLFDKLRQTAKAQGVEPKSEEQAQRSRPLIEAVLKGILERDLYDNGSYMRAVNPLDPVYNRAVEIITNPELYDKYLTGQLNR